MPGRKRASWSDRAWVPAAAVAALVIGAVGYGVHVDRSIDPPPPRQLAEPVSPRASASIAPGPWRTGISPEPVPQARDIALLPPERVETAAPVAEPAGIGGAEPPVLTRPDPVIVIVPPSDHDGGPVEGDRDWRQPTQHSAEEPSASPFATAGQMATPPPTPDAASPPEAATPDLLAPLTPRPRLAASRTSAKARAGRARSTRTTMRGHRGTRVFRYVSRRATGPEPLGATSAFIEYVKRKSP